MAEQIKMPQLSDTMSDGKILEWHVKEGQTVKRGDILAEVETDKANLEIESFYSGVVLKIITPAGGVAGVGEIIAVIGQEGESAEPSVNGSGSKSAAPAAAEPKEVAAPLPQNAAPAPKAEVVSAPAPEQVSRHDDSEHAPMEERVKASPLARKLAEQRSIDLNEVRGSGPQGRIVRRDLEGAENLAKTTAKTDLDVQKAHPEASPQTTKSAESPAPTATRTMPSTPGGGKLTELSKMRSTIARRMQESVQQSPHFYATVSIRMDNVVRLRTILKEKADYKGVSVNHFVIKAAALALKAVPRANASMKDGKLFEPDQINIGIVTAIEDGLLIPVVKEADSLPLTAIVFESKAAVERARAGRPSSSDLTGGTFSISNLGMFDVENFTAIINPGQGGILAVSSIKDEPVVDEGTIKIGKVMKVTVSVDHRIIDGVAAGQFLKVLREVLEEPALLM